MTEVARRPLAAPRAVALPWSSSDWKTELAQSFRRPEDLLFHLGLAGPLSREAESEFSFLVTRHFASRMRRNDPEDPLLRQVLPAPDELVRRDGFTADALDETTPSSSKARGLLQKYEGRALLLAAGACAINCRYCFRRSFPYTEHRTALGGPVLDAIRSDATLSEVILSGGDPLLVDDFRFARLIAELAEIPHVRRVRIHSRIPIVLPQRATAPLLEALSESGLQIVVVAHANHPRELSPESARGFELFREAGATLLNQSVLLAGVNDDASVLAELSETLFRQGVLPYYLHLLDRVTGTGHFEVDEDRARELHQELQAILPGYLVPRLAREVPGEASKVVLGR